MSRTIVQYDSSEDREQATWLMEELQARGRGGVELIQQGVLPTGEVGDTILLVGGQEANACFRQLVTLGKFSPATPTNPRPLNQTMLNGVLYYGVGGYYSSDTSWLRVYWTNAISPVGSDWIMNMEDGSEIRIGRDTDVGQLNEQLGDHYIGQGLLGSVLGNMGSLGGLALIFILILVLTGGRK